MAQKERKTRTIERNIMKENGTEQRDNERREKKEREKDKTNENLLLFPP